MLRAVTTFWLRAIVLATAALAGCGGGAGPSQPSPPSIPQIAGTYSGPTTDSSINPPQPVQTWQIKSSRAGLPGPVFRNCAGTVTIEQSGSTFSGSFIQQDSCGGVAGQVANGVLALDGTLKFSLNGPASDPLAWTGFAQCSAVVGGTLDFTGTVSAGFLDASFVRDALIQCPTEGTITINVRIRGKR